MKKKLLMIGVVAVLGLFTVTHQAMAWEGIGQTVIVYPPSGPAYTQCLPGVRFCIPD